jgi:hypothetical protein
MIAGADGLVDAETLLHRALARGDLLRKQRPHTPLLVQHAFG